MTHKGRGWVDGGRESDNTFKYVSSDDKRKEKKEDRLKDSTNTKFVIGEQTQISHNNQIPYSKYTTKYTHVL